MSKMKNNEKKEPKANYFLRRMKEAYDNGLTSKGDYYHDRLVKMGIRPTRLPK